MKKLTKVLLASLVCATLGVADDFSYNSLIAVEGGASTFNVENTDGSFDKDFTLSSVGLKIGAESERYRAFLGARYYMNSTIDPMFTYGVELQYLLNLGSALNLFIGGGIGMAEIEMKDTLGQIRKTSDSYLSGDLGFNIHAGSNLDVELGARIVNVDATNEQTTGGTYQYNNLITGYASLIYKFKMD
ncbi:MAG: hypothetical protein IE887_04295 [Campylobacterales bacterium]|nr:hypothetical protein [Campylobacterales bacterium]